MAELWELGVWGESGLRILGSDPDETGLWPSALLA